MAERLISGYTHTINGIEHVEVVRKACIGDFVISSEQVGQPRIYSVYHVTVYGRTVLGRYSRGHASLSDYKVLEPLPPTIEHLHNSVKQKNYDVER